MEQKLTNLAQNRINFLEILLIFAIESSKNYMTINTITKKN